MTLLLLADARVPRCRDRIVAHADLSGNLHGCVQGAKLPARTTMALMPGQPVDLDRIRPPGPSSQIDSSQW